MRLKLVPQETSFDFFKRWKLWLGFSGLLMVIAFASFMIQGLNFGIDFRGGTTIRTESAQPVDIGVYRDAIAPLGLGDVTITEVFDPTFEDDQNVAMIRIQAQEGEESVTGEMVTAVEDALRGAVPDIQFTSVESVGPKVSGELIQTAVIAVVLAIGAVLIYIWLRFEWQFALGAVAALIHDVLLTIGIFSELQIRFDLAIIAALLTIVGYSLNDTVVVFDRIRENLGEMKSSVLETIYNTSIDQTISRTLITSVTTFLTVLILYIFGGDVIRGFTFAILIGIIVGTYSSIFVASPISLDMINRSGGIQPVVEEEKKEKTKRPPANINKPKSKKKSRRS